jgi:hypothetical protein
MSPLPASRCHNFNILSFFKKQQLSKNVTSSIYETNLSKESKDLKSFEQKCNSI